MSSYEPPQYPLLKAELPYSCKMNGDDSFVHDLNTKLERLYILARDPQNTKKRAADQQQASKIPSEAKRRLTTKDDISKETILQLENVANMDYPVVEDTVETIITEAPQALILQAHSDVLSNNPSESNEVSLPSPSASPKQYNHFDEDSKLEENKNIVSSKSLVELLSGLAISSLPKDAINNLIFKLISQADRSSLSDFRDLLQQGLKRDLLMTLPFEISYKILLELDYHTLNNVTLVSKSWNELVNRNLWKHLLIRDNLIESHEIDVNIPNYHHQLYMNRCRLLRNWRDPNFEPKRTSIIAHASQVAHGSQVVTCLQFDDEKVISGADDRLINVYNAKTGEQIRVLEGHDGGVWALKYVGNQIVSGSTDRSVRVWNIKTGKCTHIFRGHTSTIRCMEIVQDPKTGEKRIITGSRDNTLHVWKLPSEDDLGENYNDQDPNNPYLVCVLRGHTASVRTVTGEGNIVISGSYDHTIIVWDLETQQIKHVLQGHTERIYSIVLDTSRNRCISASMDSNVRAWDLETGECIATMTDHTALVGLLGISNNSLISAATDGTVRVWDPSTYVNKYTLHHADHAAITTVDVTSNLLISGSEGQLNLYDISNGAKLIRSNLLGNCGQIWSAKMNYNMCVVALEKNNQSVIEILDFSKRA